MTNKNESLESLIGSYFSDERDQEAAALMLEEFGRHLQARIDALERILRNVIADLGDIGEDGWMTGDVYGDDWKAARALLRKKD